MRNIIEILTRVNYTVFYDRCFSKKRNYHYHLLKFKGENDNYRSANKSAM